MEKERPLLQKEPQAFTPGQIKFLLEDFLDSSRILEHCPGQSAFRDYHQSRFDFINGLLVELGIDGSRAEEILRPKLSQPWIRRK